LVPLAGATASEVMVEVLFPGADVPEPRARAVEPMARAVSRERKAAMLRIIHPDPGLPWPHLKLVTVDGLRTYVGSANLTAGARGPTSRSRLGCRAAGGGS
jgi:phosphatidylserine/phosphatidylglycerophosphate/cardiolipin synthase-like enzyme